MKHVSIKQAKDNFPALARKAEAGEKIVITRNGKPVAELGPCTQPQRLNLAAIEEWKKRLGVESLITYIADDFDDPLPEDFLITPGPH